MPTKINPPLNTIAVTVNGKEFIVGKCKALPSLTAIGILSRHAKHLKEVVRQSVEITKDTDDEKEGDDERYIEYFVDVLTTMSPVLENPMDVFKFVSLLSGIPEEELAESDAVEFVDVIKAVWKMNRILEMVTLVTNR